MTEGGIDFSCASRRAFDAQNNTLQQMSENGMRP